MRQRKWLERFDERMLKETVLEDEALDQGEFNRQAGFARPEEVFERRLQWVLDGLTETV